MFDAELPISCGSRQAFPQCSRSFNSQAVPSAVPKGLPGKISTPGEFLSAIGRSSETKLEVEEWAKFWQMTGPEMKTAGVSVKDRRYIMWCMNRYRLGEPIKDFAHEAKPKKKIRGRGPAVQNGKRIRSRRDR
ncbi:hypothetical protein CONPUDRAFT_165224 [Coniophora puteana RWD-64-598 SS2]|uniref:Small ribosomal subunit protein mS41 n=1 Tax=Coniophora puteana (strain RWD-64-598) TaxID=741705 RepID=A0A5M3MPL3_CONPW|nr:uncharacterized protein CONPUDRAFT_165224 [Coniophora puteana RWD-64-598 SS2]EIW80987.1 hypothetical protein CONPUDRAFT_165224 [Coniophora puteana RWD-64-598 SS2]